MVDILFTYQHKTREIESLCLLKLEMERRGFTTDFLCTFQPNRIFSFFKRARLTVSSGMYDNDALWFFVYDIVGFTKKIVNLQWEQVLSNFDEADPNCYHNPKEYAKGVIHLCWGEEPMNRIIKNGVESTNAPITGAVHLDFLLNEFNSYYFNKTELAQKFNLDSQSEWCLFISSFTLHNMTEEEYNQLIDCCCEEEIIELKKLTVNSKNKILDWIERALLEFQYKTFIYRPHPDETSDESLLQMERKYKNFKIIPDLSVKQWIKYSDRIYTWISTAVADVAMGHKGFDILRPIKIPQEYDLSFYKGTNFIESEEFFLKSLQTYEQLIPLDIGLLHRYYKNDETYPAYMRVADILETALITKDLDMKEYPSAISVDFGLIKKKLKVSAINIIIKLMDANARKVPFLTKSLEHSYAFGARLKRDLPKNLATPDEIRTICSKLRPIVNSDFFSNNKYKVADINA